ncbi:rhodanese-related sulfurtransferase [Skeletonema marinoi]|uniref:Rhodanese-related sulfurtransferase n=1 Tax=Skeletonema marinoi TaxID=267567 RepID=A0AAD8Y0H8_9STRA|nr:rhodanese-related sulfurtransferase [Skeletonema marinoi]
MHCILFYKYHPLTDDKTLLETYRSATENLCIALNLKGRILIGLSNNGEGINGTLAGAKDDLDAYVDCMLGNDCCSDDPHRRDAVNTFHQISKQFFNELNAPELLLDSPNDFKWSSNSPDAALKESGDNKNNNNSNNDGDDDQWFPDLNIKIVKEIISTGGVLSNISTTETSVGYLTPREWHEEIKSLVEKKQAKSDASGDDDDVDTVLIDVRNHKECQIGAFAPGISVDPKTKTFAQFPKWVKDNAGNDVEATPANDANANISSSSAAAAAAPSSSLLNNKRILLYCTGGIRCEKASAFVRQMVPQNKGIFHLKGGIHKYLEEFGSEESQFVGKNFVFDRRGALNASDCGKESANSGNSTTAIVGKCLYCKDPYDTFSPENVCTVCREPVLVCSKCKSDLEEKQLCSGPEFHCEEHFHLASFYFTNLSGFSVDDLRKQLEELNAHLNPLLALKKKGKQRRKSLRKQINKVESFLKNLIENGPNNHSGLAATVCRHCGSSSCDKKCWGFHGGNKCLLNKLKTGSDVANDCSDLPNSKKRTRTPSNQRPSKVLKREKDLSEIQALQLCQTPSQYRSLTGLKCPPPVIRRLSSSVKGRWCGQTLRQVLTSEFGLKHERLDQLLAAGLVHINGTQQSLDTILQNGDRISRIVHWHEPPLVTPAKITVTKHSVSQLFEEGSSADSSIYVIDKPATVPIYPAGPFYANSLLSMIEAQEGLQPKSLLPCHRLDRCTSGVLLCTNTSSAASLVQRHLKGKKVKKLYLARVKGKFPTTPAEMIHTNVPDCASLGWNDDVIEISAPISVQFEDSSSDDMLKRFVSPDGKPSISRFRTLSYDQSSDLSIVAACPISGRGHQLRLHLQVIGYPIHNDVQYGGLMENEKKKQLLTMSVDAMLNASAKNLTCLREESVSSEEAESAIKMCLCCSDGRAGVETSYKDYQLLGAGQAIDLHAAQYCIDSGNEHKANFVTDLPHWAGARSNEDLQWLN